MSNAKPAWEQFIVQNIREIYQSGLGSLVRSHIIPIDILWECVCLKQSLQDTFVAYCREDETLTPDIMKDIGRVESLQKYVRQADYAFYTAVLDILIPDILRPIPSMLEAVSAEHNL